MTEVLVCDQSDCGRVMASYLVVLTLYDEPREVLSTRCQECAQRALLRGYPRYVEAWEHGTPIKETSA